MINFELPIEIGAAGAVEIEVLCDLGHLGCRLAEAEAIRPRRANVDFIIKKSYRTIR